MNGRSDMVMNYKPKQDKDPEPVAMRCKRIDIPFEPYDDMLLRDVAEALRAVAYRIEFWAKIDREEREKRIMTQAEINSCNDMIRKVAEAKGYYWRAGRPKALEIGWAEKTNPEICESPPRLQLLKPALRLHPDSAGS